VPVVPPTKLKSCGFLSFIIACTVTNCLLHKKQFSLINYCSNCDVGSVFCRIGLQFAARNVAISAALLSVQFNIWGTRPDPQRSLYWLPKHTQGQVGWMWFDLCFVIPSVILVATDHFLPSVTSDSFKICHNRQFFVPRTRIKHVTVPSGFLHPRLGTVFHVKSTIVRTVKQKL